MYAGKEFSNKNPLSAVCNWKFEKHQRKIQIKSTMQEWIMNVVMKNKIEKKLESFKKKCLLGYIF